MKLLKGGSCVRLRLKPSGRRLARFLKFLSFIILAAYMTIGALEWWRARSNAALLEEAKFLRLMIASDNAASQRESLINGIRKGGLLRESSEHAYLLKAPGDHQRPNSTAAVAPPPSAESERSESPGVKSAVSPSPNRVRWEKQLSEITANFKKRPSEELPIKQVMLVGFGTPVGALILLFAGRRLDYINVRAALRGDRRLPILYLRSFGHDKKKFSDQQQKVEISEEELLATALNRVGPVIAMGRPGEWLPPCGAARFYAAHHEWQRAVACILPFCRAVILRIGGTAGIEWELSHVREQFSAKKLALYVPNSINEREFQEARPLISRALRGEMPMARLGSYFVVFDNQWRGTPFVPNVPFSESPGLERLATEARALAARFSLDELPTATAEEWRVFATRSGLL
jgi:hypothetical protein